MKTLGEEINRIVEEQVDLWAGGASHELQDDLADSLESAIFEAIQIVLEREPSHETICAGINAIDEAGFGPGRSERVYRAMTAELLKELVK